MAFSYSASTRISIPPSSSSSSTLQSQPQSQQLLPNPQIQQLQHQYHHQYQDLIHAMDSSSRTSSASSSSHHNHHQNQQQQPQQHSPRPLQGPRPAPLKVRKDSYKIKKPPVAPGAHHHLHHHQSGHHHHQQQQNQQQLPRQPVIIYTVSPKVIHTKPSDFMSLVQRLTGVNSSPTAAASAAAESQPSPGAFPSPGPAGAVSPAARLATIEKVHQQSAAEHHHHPYRSLAASAAGGGDDLDSMIAQFDDPASSAAAAAVLDYRAGAGSLPFAPPAILSPNPSSLPGISPSFFSSGADLNSLGILEFLSGLSPMAGAAAITTTTAAATASSSLPAPAAAPITSRGGFIDSSFLLSPPSGAHAAFGTSLLLPSPGGLIWPSGLGFTPTAGAPSPNWDIFGSFPDL